MKNAPVIIVTVTLALAQAVVLSVLPGATPQAMLAFIVIASIYLSYSQLLWMALLGGFILDLYSAGGAFGFNIAFLLLTAMIVKLFLRPADQSMRLGYSLMLIAAFSTLSYLLSLAAILHISPIINYGHVGLNLAIAIGYNIVIGAILFACFEAFTNRKKRGSRVGGR